MKRFLLAAIITIGMVGQSANAALLSLSDDSFSQQSIGFDFDFLGSTYDTVFVGSNGFLTFGSGDADWTESVSDFLNDQARIAVWDDFNPSVGGTIEAIRTADYFRASYNLLPEFPNTGSNSFDITIFRNGTIEIFFESLTTNDLIVGLSAGNGTTAAEVDFSTSDRWSNSNSIYQQFTSAFDLNGSTLTFVSAPNVALMFGLGLALATVRRRKLL